jgi:hypothetical protein
MKKVDIIIITVVIIIASIFFGINKYNEKMAENDVLYVEINVDGKLYKRVNLQAKEEIVINGHGTNTIKVDSGTVEMTHSDCPDKVCVKTGKISRVGRSIVCLPNKVYVEIVGKKEGEVDAVSE